MFNRYIRFVCLVLACALAFQHLPAASYAWAASVSPSTVRPRATDNDPEVKAQLAADLIALSHPSVPASLPPKRIAPNVWRAKAAVLGLWISTGMALALLSGCVGPTKVGVATHLFWLAAFVGSLLFAMVTTMHSGRRRSVTPGTPNANWEMRLSRWLAYVLRHGSARSGVTLDMHGWASLQAVLAAARRTFRTLTEAQLRTLVAGPLGQRFTIDGDRIRARYGHSVEATPASEPTEPPGWLYHGTTRRRSAAIIKDGLLPMRRQMVHLYDRPEDALEVTRRRGWTHPVLLKVRAQDAHRAGVAFYPGGRVWLARGVPAEFLGESDKLSTSFEARITPDEQALLQTVLHDERFLPRTLRKLFGARRSWAQIRAEYVVEVRRRWPNKRGGTRKRVYLVSLEPRAKSAKPLDFIVKAKRRPAGQPVPDLELRQLLQLSSRMFGGSSFIPWFGVGIHVSGWDVYSESFYPWKAVADAGTELTPRLAKAVAFEWLMLPIWLQRGGGKPDVHGRYLAVADPAPANILYTPTTRDASGYDVAIVDTGVIRRKRPDEIMLKLVEHYGHAEVIAETAAQIMDLHGAEPFLRSALQHFQHQKSRTPERQRQINALRIAIEQQLAVGSGASRDLTESKAPPPPQPGGGRGTLSAIAALAVLLIAALALAATASLEDPVGGQFSQPSTQIILKSVVHMLDGVIMLAFFTLLPHLRNWLRRKIGEWGDISPHPWKMRQLAVAREQEIADEFFDHVTRSLAWGVFAVFMLLALVQLTQGLADWMHPPALAPEMIALAAGVTGAGRQQSADVVGAGVRAVQAVEGEI